MSKPRKPRTLGTGKFVDPLVNELDWLDDEAEVPIRIDGEPKTRSRKPAAKTPLAKKTNKRKNDPSAKINVSDGMAAAVAKQSRRAAQSAPLLLIDKPKPRYRRNASWFGQLLGFDRWTDQRASGFSDVLQSFQLGLDGVLKSGEELRIVSPRHHPVVIDVVPEEHTEIPVSIKNEAPADTATEPELHDAPPQEQADFAEAQPVPGPDSADASASSAHYLQQYGLVPFRFTPFDRCLDIYVTFDEPFQDDGYALVATTNEPGCRTVIVSKARESAVVRLLRDTPAPHLSGEMNWIALGDQ
ncbi:hypothetical protein SD70_24455 [Gordoniibacillus kamchatkensis]|uniref:Uncharacterized protein n=1 Tax=Gordoniibacillus kamchatkensis TaxID=1590651 RepID=A0ABR5ACJ6_9BACL|nr:WIAG-tail domain [Paenibacillus sp. VKM B-2647]KIL38758.1 hypothetical protein SD70_24455 [Paenibacillus sp. VKM B-2647]